MSIASIIRNVVKQAHSITSKGGLQPTTTFQAWTGQDATGKPTYASAKDVLAIVERKRRLIRRGDGQEVVSQHALTILLPPKDTTPTSGFTRENPIDPRDKFTLPNGATGPILDVHAGVVDGDDEDGGGFMYEVFLG